jgi:hypothetical protein
MSYTNYLEDKIQDHVHGGAAFTAPSGQYLGLFSVTPSDAGGGTELSGDGYARQSITFDDSTGGLSTNTNTLTFTASGGDWSAAVAGAVFDAATGGNMLEWNSITSVTVVDGANLVYGAGDIDSTLS